MRDFIEAIFAKVNDGPNVARCLSMALSDLEK